MTDLHLKSNKPPKSQGLKKSVIPGIIGSIVSAICVYFAMGFWNGSSDLSAEQFYSELEKYTQMLNSKLPMQVDEVTSFQKTSLDRANGNIIYIYSLENNKKPITEDMANFVAANKDVFRNEVIKSACSDKNVVKMLQFETSGARINSLKYVYYHKDRQVIDFSISLEDCMNMKK